MQVILLPPDPTWPAAYARAAAELTPALGPSLLSLHHIGSTSIPHIHAKPIIDLLAVVTTLDDLDARNPHLQSLGYTPKGEFGIPTRRYFPRNDPAGQRTHQLHAFPQGSPHIPRHLAFRDYLIAHPHLAAEYSHLKQRLAAAHPQDIEAYMDGKDPFIQQTERAAIAWSEDRNKNPH